MIPPDAPISLAHLSEIETPPLPLIAAAAEAGLASIGLRTIPAAPGGVCYPLATASEQAAVRRRLADAGVGLLYIELVSLDAATDPASFAAAFEAGAAAGASRVAAAGDSDDFDLVADRLGAVADVAADFGLSVDLEFMPYRGVRSLDDAADVVVRAGRPNAFVLLDALHFFRSGGVLADLAAVDPKLLGAFQICDGPLAAPVDLVAEARLHRLPPGAGAFPLTSLLDALPPDIPIGVEAPLYTTRPHDTVTERLQALVAATRAVLKAGSEP